VKEVGFVVVFHRPVYRSNFRKGCGHPSSPAAFTFFTTAFLQNGASVYLIGGA
jgi:hypothetical protein